MTTEAEIHQTLGSLKATVDHLGASIKHMTEMWLAQEKSASEGRRALYDKVEEVKDTVTALNSRIGSVENTITAIKPAVQEFENQREQQKGAIKLGKVLWAGMLAASGTMGAAIAWAFGHLFQSGSLPPGH